MSSISRFQLEAVQVAVVAGGLVVSVEVDTFSVGFSLIANLFSTPMERVAGRKIKKLN